MGKPASAKDSSTAGKKPVKKMAATTKTPAAAAKKTVKVPAKKKPAAVATPPPPSYDDISLRAYFISEKRMQLGLPGDSAQDWVEAERQLVAESFAKKPKKKA